MSKELTLLKILSQLPKRYTPLAQVADALIKSKVIEIHRPYQGKHPHNPRYQTV